MHQLEKWELPHNWPFSQKNLLTPPFLFHICSPLGEQSQETPLGALTGPLQGLILGPYAPKGPIDPPYAYRMYTACTV